MRLSNEGFVIISKEVACTRLPDLIGLLSERFPRIDFDHSGLTAECDDYVLRFTLPVMDPTDYWHTTSIIRNLAELVRTSGVLPISNTLVCYD